MTAYEAIAILRIALDLAERMSAIAKRDPEAWDTVKADFNKAKEGFKMLVKEASQGWKMASNWVFTAIALLTVVQEQWVDVFSPILPESWYAPTVATLAILGVISRLIDQGIKS